MIKRFLTLALLAFPLAAFSATYTYNGPNYPLVNNSAAAPCGAGVCAQFKATMHLSGNFSTQQPLAVNLPNADIAPLIAAYSFTDGVNTFSNTDPASGLVFATASTDHTGAIVAIYIRATRWQGGAQALGGRVDIINLPWDTAANAICSSLNAVGTCDAVTLDFANSSYAAAGGTWVGSVGSWTVASQVASATPTSVPVNSPLALAMGILLMVGLRIFART